MVQKKKIVNEHEKMLKIACVFLKSENSGLCHIKRAGAIYIFFFLTFQIKKNLKI